VKTLVVIKKSGRFFCLFSPSEEEPGGRCQLFPEKRTEKKKPEVKVSIQREAQRVVWGS